MITPFSANPEQSVVYSIKQPLTVVGGTGEEEHYLVHYHGSDSNKAKEVLKDTLEKGATAYFCVEILLNQ